MGRDFKLSPTTFKAAIGSLGISGFAYLGFIGTLKVLYSRSLIAKDFYNEEINLTN